MIFAKKHCGAMLTLVARKLFLPRIIMTLAKSVVVVRKCMLTFFIPSQGNKDIGQKNCAGKRIYADLVVRKLFLRRGIMILAKSDVVVRKQIMLTFVILSSRKYDMVGSYPFA